MGLMVRSTRGGAAAPERSFDRSFYTEALHQLRQTTLTDRTLWAIACTADLGTDGERRLRGVLHHDGAILRFTTWGGMQRFVGCPIDLRWYLGDDTLTIEHRGDHAVFSRPRSLACLVDDVPPFAVAGAFSPLADLAEWMGTWR